MNPTPFAQKISEDIWEMKYRLQTPNPEISNDTCVQDTWERIARACLHDPYEDHVRNFAALEDFKFLPAGRIIAGAGTGRNVTLFNCFVMGTIPDTLEGIFGMLKEAALTMQQGGGIGYDFSTLRPKGASVKGVDADASGPLSFMDVWDTMCRTIMSAGSRRGAMMATMDCSHPDIEDFIAAKRDPNKLRMFNLSVLITDSFMTAVWNNDKWDLEFEGKVYKTVQAKDLWDKIMRATYDYAEPGVIFIDRINKQNNLWFLEDIKATNPCGEQPLPPYGACLLGSINLTRFVKSPFQKPSLMLTEMKSIVKTAVRMLDAVIDVSKFPYEEQKKEALYKRRMGLGVTGLADMLYMLGYRYDSEDAIFLVDNLLKQIATWAYEESILMASEFGPCPALKSKENREKFCQSVMISRLPGHIKDGIMEYGIRNTHLMSIAPTGTISLYAGNVSSGIEPIFAESYQRKVTQADSTKTTEEIVDYAVLQWRKFAEDNPEKATDWKKTYFVTTQDLKPSDHLKMQAAAQYWIDSSISKTINLPEDVSFEEFNEVYFRAYNLECKGCTTYRPNDITGSVLSIKEDTPIQEEEPLNPAILHRPNNLDGTTYKLKWQGSAIYVTFTNYEDHGKIIPFEIFINSKNPEHQAWTTALTRMISAVFRRGGDVTFVMDELKEVFDPKGGQFISGIYVPSLVALLGYTLETHLKSIGYLNCEEAPVLIQQKTTGERCNA